MKELASHIHRLLQENDCVIVPGFGGFIAHDNPAQWMESEHSFLPPSRIIAFNPLLKINDGLVAQSYMTSYRTSFSEATRRIQRAVKQLVHSLYENGSVYLPEIGELRFNIHHNYEFYPEDDKLISPTLYGLESFEMNTLEEVKQQREALQQLRAKQLEEEERQRKETERLRREAEIQRKQEEWQKQHEEQMRLAAMKRAEEKAQLTLSRRAMLRKSLRMVGTAAAMIAVLFLCFTFATPLQNTTIGTENYAELNPKEMLSNLMSHSLITQPIGENAGANTIEAIPVEEAVVPTEVAEVQVPKIYHVIIASVGASKDAQTMAEDLIHRGFQDAKAIVGDGYNRVCINSFETEQEAYAMVRQLKADNLYQQAWVLKRQ